jgi:hypothetical protein
MRLKFPLAMLVVSQKPQREFRIAKRFIVLRVAGFLFDVRIPRNEDSWPAKLDQGPKDHFC